jgi:hypothetical protein
MFGVSISIRRNSLFVISMFCDWRVDTPGSRPLLNSVMIEHKQQPQPIGRNPMFLSVGKMDSLLRPKPT